MEEKIWAYHILEEIKKYAIEKARGKNVTGTGIFCYDTDDETAGSSQGGRGVSFSLQMNIAPVYCRE